MRELIDNLKVSLQRYPRLYSILRTSQSVWFRLHPSTHHYPHRNLIRQIQAIERQVQQIEECHDQNHLAPVLFFNATSGPGSMSFNSIAGLLVSWSLRVAGQKVMHLVCRRGMPKCIQGTNWRDLHQPMPCKQCFSLRSALFPRHLSRYIEGDSEVQDELPGVDQRSLDDLAGFVYEGVDLGQLCLPSVGWALRRLHLSSIPEAQQLLWDYLQGGIRIVNAFQRLVEQNELHSVVAFNGTFFPEAIIRALALKRGLHVVTYEVGFRSSSLFLSHDIASDCPVRVPEDFQMDENQQAEFDRYLAKRMQGDFTMGGVRFWPEMKGISPELRHKVEAYRQVVTVFTNVVFDTSQTHANTIFESMFDWLDETMRLAATHLETLFIVRAHPDELRPGKESQEAVGQWLEARGHLGLPNLIFMAPTEYVSSYELIGLSHLCIVYNSTIGLEAVLLGTPVVTGAQAKYSGEKVTHAPSSREAYRDMVTSFLEGGVPSVPEAWQQRARRFMYYLLFRESLDLSMFIESTVSSIKFTEALALHPDNSLEMSIIYDGIIKGKPFCYP